MTQLLKYALKYIELSWKIFPIVPRQKVPLTAHGVKDASSDTNQIRLWWEKWPNANIAVACGQISSIYVIDVDVTEAGDINGYESLEEFPPLPETIVQATPRGGFHAFYRTDNPPANRNSFRPGIDIRGDGYYVVIAPSVHPNGGQYFWKEDHSPWEIEPVEFPEFMRPTTRAPWAKPISLRAPAAAPVAPAAADVLQRASLYLAECEPAVQGCGGHDKLLWAAVAMVHGFLLTDDQAFDILAREYNPRCVPPWDISMTKDGRDFRRKVTEARKLMPDKPRGWLLNDSTYMPTPLIPIDVKQLIAEKQSTFKEISITSNSTEAHEIEFLTHPTGLLGDICKWINTTAIRKQPLLTLACALTFCGVLFGRKVRDSLGSRTNLYCMGIAKSSAGKAHAPSQIRRLCEAAGCRDLLGGDDAASDAAIEERIQKNPACLFLWDEIGHFLSHIRSGISQHHTRIIPLLMKLYSAAGSVYKGKEYSDSDLQRTIIQPCCCIYGTSSPERFSSGISPEELQDGWLSRCLVFRTDTKPEKDRSNCDALIPQDIIDQVSKWHNRQIGEIDNKNIEAFIAYHGDIGISYQQPPQQIVVPGTSEAEDIFISFDNECTEFGKTIPILDCLWSKGEENARRIALIVAASENFNTPCITGSIADYACRLIRYLLVNFGRDTVPTIVTCQIDAQKQKLLKIINQEGVNGCPNRILTQRARWSNKKQRSALLADLIEAEEVIMQIKDGKKAPSFWTVENYRKYLAQQTEEKLNDS